MSPTVTMPAEPKTSPRTSYPYAAEKLASATAMAPLSKRMTTTAVSSSPASLNSGATSASAVAYTVTGFAPGFSHSSVSKSWISVCTKIVPGGTAAGFASPGSRVSERMSCGTPIAPAAISRRAAAKSVAKRRLKPTCSATPAARAAEIPRSISSSVSPIGFSQNTALPAAAAAVTRSRALRSRR